MSLAAVLGIILMVRRERRAGHMLCGGVDDDCSLPPHRLTAPTANTNAVNSRQLY